MLNLERPEILALHNVLVSWCEDCKKMKINEIKGRGCDTCYFGSAEKKLRKELEETQ